MDPVLLAVVAKGWLAGGAGPADEDDGALLVLEVGAGFTGNVSLGGCDGATFGCYGGDAIGVGITGLLSMH